MVIAASAPPARRYRLGESPTIRTPFSPGFASYTFPMAIGATALFKAAEQLEAWRVRQSLIDQVRGLAVFELLVATAVTVYVIVRFGRFAWTHWAMAHGPEARDA